MQHVRAQVAAALPGGSGEESIDITNTQHLMQSIRLRLNLKDLLRGNFPLQMLLKEDEFFQTLICGLVSENEPDQSVLL
jgi:hypothetical protein